MIYLLNLAARPNTKTSLVRWSKYRHDIGGFLCVNVLDQLTLRQFSTATYTQFQVPESYPGETTTFNDLNFTKTAFEVARKWMMKDLKSKKLKYFFLDEVGQLEIDNLGHNDLVKTIIEKDNADQVFIFLVREHLIEIVQEKYNFNKNKVINLKQITG